tara:strand:+ start:667 stop:948 length:282 start_codon:yes stop_codon:yes gene_type:complete
MFKISGNNNFCPAQQGVNFITPQAPQPNKVPMENMVLQKWTPSTYNWRNKIIQPRQSMRGKYHNAAHNRPFDPASPFIIGAVGNMPVTPSPFA